MKKSKRDQPRNQTLPSQQPKTTKLKLQNREENNPINYDDYSRSSEAQWEPPPQEIVKNEYQENKSQSNFSNSSKRAPNEQDLCKAILCLRKKLPQRSLQQIIIRLYQSVQYVKSTCGMSNDNKFDNKSVNSRANDFDDSMSFLNFGGEEGENFFHLNDDPQNKVDLTEEDIKRFNKMQENSEQDDDPFNERGTTEYSINMKKIGFPRAISSLQLPEAGTDYIYRPEGQEAVMTYFEKNTRKYKFINIEEQSRYVERRVMAKSFIERGYGVSECRKEIEAQELGFVLHRNTYKTLSGSVIILAFRKLQSFIANDLGKTIKFLDRWQMRSICTVMLNCRTTMEPEQMATLFKFIRASYGLGDVTIGEIEAVKLYLACQKFMYGKNVTMQTLERLGEIQHKKNIELTLEYLNRKKHRRDMRLQKLRVQRLETKSSKGTEEDNDLDEINLEDLEHLKLEMDDEIGSTDPSSETKLEVKLEDKETTERQTSVGNEQSSAVQSEGVEMDEVKEQEPFWNENMDLELANLYLEHLALEMPIKILKEKYSEVSNWTVQDFIKKYHKLLKKSVRKVQLQSQIIQNHCTPALCKLIKQEVQILVKHPKAENIRHQLLDYYLQEQPNLSKLTSAVSSIIRFISSSAIAGNQAMLRDSWKRQLQKINKETAPAFNNGNSSQVVRITYPKQHQLYASQSSKQNPRYLNKTAENQIVQALNSKELGITSMQESMQGEGNHQDSDSYDRHWPTQEQFMGKQEAYST